MFESILGNNKKDAIHLLKMDHKRVKELFDEFEQADRMQHKMKLASEAILALKLHASVEEEIFYPTVRNVVDLKTMNEADEEHHVAKILIAELEKMTPKDQHFEAKFMVLAESVRHHIKEEESSMLPVAEESAIDFEGLGMEMLQRKEELMKNGFPPSAEEKMVGSRQDIQAVVAKQERPSKKTSKKKKTAKPKSSTAHRMGRNGHMPERRV
jgi:hemerythrin superfamily protein